VSQFGAEKFTTRSRDVIEAAQLSATTAGNTQTDPVHLLVALLRPEDSTARTLVTRSGADATALTAKAEQAVAALPTASGATVQQPAASPALTARWWRGDGPDWAAMPLVVFNEKDGLQDDALRQLGVARRPAVVHRVPSSVDFLEAVRLGLGWAMLPEPQAGPGLASGTLERLPGDRDPSTRRPPGCPRGATRSLRANLAAVGATAPTRRVNTRTGIQSYRSPRRAPGGGSR